MLRAEICSALYKSGIQQKAVALSLGFDEQSFSKMLSGALRLDVDVFEVLVLRVLGPGPLISLLDRCGFKVIPKEKTREEMLAEVMEGFESLRRTLEILRGEIENADWNNEQQRKGAGVYPAYAGGAQKRDGAGEARRKASG